MIWLPRSVIIEDLHVSGMLKNHHLAQAIGDVGFAVAGRVRAWRGFWVVVTDLIAVAQNIQVDRSLLPNWLTDLTTTKLLAWNEFQVASSFGFFDSNAAYQAAGDYLREQQRVL